MCLAVFFLFSSFPFLSFRAVRPSLPAVVRFLGFVRSLAIGIMAAQITAVREEAPVFGKHACIGIIKIGR